MNLNASQLGSHLRTSLEPCYVVAGEEPLLMVEAQDAIRAAAFEQGFTEREVLDAGHDFDWSRFLESCVTGSLFAARRLVELRMVHGPGEAGREALKSFAESPPKDVLLLVIAGKLDGRARSGGWYGALERAGAAFYAWPLRANEFPHWLERRLVAAGLTADPDALAMLADRTQGNLLAAAQEVSKLAQIYAPGHIHAGVIMDNIADVAHFGAFDWIDRILAGDGLETARGLKRMREQGEPLPVLVSVLAMDLRKLAQFIRKNDARSAGILRMRQIYFASGKDRLTVMQVYGGLQRLSRIDQLIKRGADAAAWESMLSLTMSLSRTRRRRVSLQ